MLALSRTRVRVRVLVRVMGELGIRNQNHVTAIFEAI